MSSEAKSEEITFKLRKVYTDYGAMLTVVDIYVGDREVVYGARTLAEAVEEFGYKM